MNLSEHKNIRTNWENCYSIYERDFKHESICADVTTKTFLKHRFFFVSVNMPLCNYRLFAVTIIIIKKVLYMTNKQSANWKYGVIAVDDIVTDKQHTHIIVHPLHTIFKCKSIFVLFDAQYIIILTHRLVI